MLEVLSATVPIFLVVGVGFLCTRFGLFARTDMAILNRFVVKIALPLLVFVNVFGRSASEIFNPAYLLTYALASLAMFALAHAWAAARRAPVTDQAAGTTAVVVYLRMPRMRGCVTPVPQSTCT